MPKTSFPTWFPLRSDMMDGEEWAALTVAERALFLTMLRDDNQREPGWYRADLEYAVEVKLSEDKVRRARRKFQALGIVDVVPGFRSRGRTVATTYNAVKWSKPPVKKDKVFFAHMGRYYWETMLDYIRDSRFTHADAVVIASVIYMDALIPRREKREGVTRIAKSELRRLSGVDRVQDSVERLYTAFQFASKEHLFEYRPGHSHVAFWGFQSFSENTNAELDGNRRSILHKAISSKREKAKAERLKRDYDAIVKRYGPILDAKLTAYIEHGLEPDISRVALEAVQAKVIQLRGAERWERIGPKVKTDKAWLLQKHILPYLGN